jgi:hypothetical protein
MSSSLQALLVVAFLTAGVPFAAWPRMKFVFQGLGGWAQPLGTAALRGSCFAIPLGFDKRSQ